MSGNGLNQVRPLRRSILEIAGSTIVYGFLALGLFGISSPLGSTAMSGAQTSDQFQQIWFLDWGAHAVSHAVSPFFSPQMNHPVGINVAANNSMLGLSIPFAPLTEVFGAFATWNVLLRLAVLLSALAAQFACRRVVRWGFASFVAGLIYGFSGYMTFWAIGYLNFIFVPFIPLIFLGLYALFTRKTRHPGAVGAAMGAGFGVEYLVSPEIAAVTLVMTVLAVAIVVIGWRHAVRERWASIRRAAIWGAVTLAAVTAYPVFFAFHGRANLGGFSAVPSATGDALGLFVPGSGQFINPRTGVWHSFSQYFHSAPLYLGITCLLITAGVAVWLRHRPVVAVTGLLAGLSLVFSLGSKLTVSGHTVPIPLPFWFISHFPGLSNIVPTRFALTTAFFAGIVIACGLDELRHRVLATKGRMPATARRLLATALPLAVTALILVPLVPAGAERTDPPPIDRFFTSPAVARIPTGSAVLMFPYPSGRLISPQGNPVPSGELTHGLVDQVAAGLRFQLVGGYGWMPPKRSTGRPDPTPLAPLSVQRFFDDSFFGASDPAMATPSTRLQLRDQIRTFVRSYSIGTVVVNRSGLAWYSVVQQMNAALGPADITSSSFVWFRASQRASARS